MFTPEQIEKAKRQSWYMLGTKWEDIYIAVFPGGPPTFVDASASPPDIDGGDQIVFGDRHAHQVLHIEQLIGMSTGISDEARELAEKIVFECLGE